MRSSCLPMTKAYEYRHTVSFEETNFLGNAYYAHFVRWQGICREMFLRDQAPEILSQLERGLVLSTVRCSCQYFAELKALDTVLIRMKLASVVWNRLLLQFEYLRVKGDETEEVAFGEQEIACLERKGEETAARAFPPALLEALEPYRSDPL